MITPTLQSSKGAVYEPTGGRSFLTNLKYTDMVLVVKVGANPPAAINGQEEAEDDDSLVETEYPCHKFQLARKSDVFDAMFTHKFKESLTNRVVISGLDPAAVLEMLRFIYEGKVNNLPSVDRCLLEAADMYNIGELKSLCEKSICEVRKGQVHISGENPHWRGKNNYHHAMS